VWSGDFVERFNNGPYGGVFQTEFVDSWKVEVDSADALFSADECPSGESVLGGGENGDEPPDDFSRCPELEIQARQQCPIGPVYEQCVADVGMTCELDKWLEEATEVMEEVKSEPDTEVIKEVDETTDDETTDDETTDDETTDDETTDDETTDDETTDDETTDDETTVDETTVDETTDDETTVDETTDDETTVDETTDDETTVDETTVDETTVDETTDDETTDDETTNDETTDDETTDDETTVDETTNDETTDDETTDDETTVDETTDDETTDDETTDDETTDGETTDDETTDDETTVDETTVDETTDDETTDDETTDDETTDDETTVDETTDDETTDDETEVVGELNDAGNSGDHDDGDGGEIHGTPCFDGNHDCDTLSTQCLVLGPGEYTCECMEGYVPAVHDDKTCLARADSSHGDVVSAGYCSMNNQDLTLWVIPGTQGYRCAEAGPLMPDELTEGEENYATEPLFVHRFTPNFPSAGNNSRKRALRGAVATAAALNDDFTAVTQEQCFNECTVSRGGPPSCNYIDFDDNGRCLISSSCAGFATPKDDLVLDEENILGVTNVLCAFKNSVGKTCAPEGQTEGGASTVVPHLTSCFDSCFQDEECLVFMFDADSSTCARFSQCSSFVDSPQPNARVFMMNDNLNYPSGFIDV
jgi:hypothetical protein